MYLPRLLFWPDLVLQLAMQIGGISDQKFMRKVEKKPWRDFTVTLPWYIYFQGGY